MGFLRGLFALFFIFQTSLYANFLYKDEVTSNPAFANEVEKIGSELYDKTGIKFLLVMLDKLPDGSIINLEKSILKGSSTPTIILAFSKQDMKVDIAVSDAFLYDYFDKKQVLSPAASQVQAFLLAMLYADSFSSFKELLSSHGGTILPVLSQKTKPHEEASKYAAAMFNGYADIAMQVASAKKVELDSSVGNSSQISVLVLKVIFYGVLLYALILFIKNRYKKRIDK